jgi:hypothetical protein
VKGIFKRSTPFLLAFLMGSFSSSLFEPVQKVPASTYPKSTIAQQSVRSDCREVNDDPNLEWILDSYLNGLNEVRQIRRKLKENEGLSKSARRNLKTRLRHRDEWLTEMEKELDVYQRRKNRHSVSINTLIYRQKCSD